MTQPPTTPDPAPVPATRCPQCLRETMVAVSGGGLRCANASCRREWPPRVFGCLVVLLLVPLLLLAGCGAVEQHEQDKQQEARLAELEARVIANEERMRDVVAIVADALARARASIAAALRQMGGGR